MNGLGYSSARKLANGLAAAEITRVNPVRGRIAYGATFLSSDLESEGCHERLRVFSRRRTRHRSSIPFFIGVAEDDKQALEDLLQRLDIRSATRGGHVQIVSIPLTNTAAQRPAARKRG